MTGIVCMWVGLKADVPDGWVVCDGTNGTPDFRFRHPRGASEPFWNPGKIWGSNFFTSTGQVDPDSHDHQASSSSEGPYLPAGDELLSDPPEGNLDSGPVTHDHDITVDADSHDHNLAMDQTEYYAKSLYVHFIMKL